LVKQGYRIDEVRQMTKPEIEVRLDFISRRGKPATKTYKSLRNKEAR
jgi:hypothetical protein